jgi:hypothetical protein
MSETDPELEHVFKATDALVSHLAKELGRTESECATAMFSWLEDRLESEVSFITLH